MRKKIPALLAALVLPVVAQAAPISGDEARSVLFGASGTQVALNPQAELSDEDQKIVRLLIETNGFKYYGAIAYSPDEGLLSEALQGAFNYHDAETASRAALTACNAARKAGTKACIVAAQVLPKRYKRQELQLSQDATQAFGEYRRSRDEKAMATSASTGAFGVATGEGAELRAITDCAQRASANDCVIVLRN